MFQNVSKPTEAIPTYECPCCKSKALHGRGGFEICPICYWTDDGQDDHDADLVRGGPNGSESLSEARRKYMESRDRRERYLRDVMGQSDDSK